MHVNAGYLKGGEHYYTFSVIPAYLSAMFGDPTGPVVSGESCYNPESFRECRNDLLLSIRRIY